eukprot:TRINITY_DN3142_c3_g1_i1.p1 TRINITY_DN3142_c3_g1~~TRINITY_DN3142_c3_g1_i1.p1  ORF type:complete len:479 (+),score=67.24 TRINITY_DN3142_c3_g1_i1:452-1888(+)
MLVPNISRTIREWRSIIKPKKHLSLGRFTKGTSTLRFFVLLGVTNNQSDSFFGGDFQGIIDNIHYLKNLGITGVYFCPIFHAESNHKYDTIDYMEVDPQFGTKEKLKEMVRVLHDNNIKVMIDSVFNHSGQYFAPFQDVLKYQEKSKYVDWFYISKFPIKVALEEGEKSNYSTFAFITGMPKLNTSNPDTRNYLLNVARYWTKEFDIDGWRLDVANEIDQSFWRDFSSTVKSINPNVFILGEVWHNSLKWLNGDQFHSTMNYPVMYLLLDYLHRKMSPQTFVEKLTSILYWYPQTVNNVLFNLLGSHDTHRILTLLNEDKALRDVAFVFLYTYVGLPCLYYGDEISMLGENDPDCRRCMEWDPTKQDTSTLQLVTSLIKLRSNENSLIEGNVSFLCYSNQHGYICYKRTHKDETIVVILNPVLHDYDLNINLETYFPVGVNFVEKHPDNNNNNNEVQSKNVTIPAGCRYKILHSVDVH